MVLENKDLTQSYEDLSYPNDAYAVCDPAFLIAHAKLHLSRLGGDIDILNPLMFNNELSNMRILEIGCACGGNIIPLAAKYPRIQCVGVDLSSSQIERAQQDAKALQLENIELYAGSILDIELKAHSFDIIIAHGVLSWVDTETASAIMAHSGNLLKEHGLLYVSYNTLPGWYQEKAIRDMMEFHARGANTANAELIKAREILDIGAKLATDEHYKANLRDEQRVIEHVPDGYLYHDYLETYNEPYYLKDVARLAQVAGCAYLGDCDLSGYKTTSHIEAFIQLQADDCEYGQHVIDEQYQDFFTNRRFRQSIFIKGSITPAQDRHNNEIDLQGFSFLLNADMEDELSRYELSKAKRLSLVPRHNENSEIVRRVQDKDAVTIMRYLLMQRFTPIPYAHLHALFNHIEKRQLSQVLLTLLYDGLITLRHVGVVQARSTLYPQAWYVSRYYASIDTTSINLYHKNLDLDPASRRLLTLCDGTRSRDELVKIIEDDTEKACLKAEKIEDNYPYILLGENILSYSHLGRKELVQFFVDDALIQFSKLGLLLE